mmetsp:Transcript_87330/g.271290  ORF Transcript_87330/g.271290 Transcript_87330/m.271290 type:complete len:232 (-) Transcript_87330:1309-2004(-)
MRAAGLQLLLLGLGALVVLKTGGKAEVRLPVLVLGEDQDVGGVRRDLCVLRQLYGHRASNGHILDVAVLGPRLPALSAALPPPIERVVGHPDLRLGLVDGHRHLRLRRVGVLVRRRLEPQGAVRVALHEARLDIVHDLQAGRGRVVPVLVLRVGQQVRRPVRDLGAAGDVVRRLLARTLGHVADQGALGDLLGGGPAPVQRVLLDLGLVLGPADRHGAADLVLVAVLIFER